MRVCTITSVELHTQYFVLKYRGCIYSTGTGSNVPNIYPTTHSLSSVKHLFLSVAFFSGKSTIYVLEMLPLSYLFQRYQRVSKVEIQTHVET